MKRFAIAIALALCASVQAAAAGCICNHLPCPCAATFMQKEKVCKRNIEIPLCPIWIDPIEINPMS